jgi:hypothetical protein
LLTHAEYETPEGPRTAFELITGRGGIPLALEEREVLEQLDSRPLRLYEVGSIEPGRGFVLVDVVTGERSSVEERSASEQVDEGEVLAARLLHRGAAITLSGIVLPFPRLELQWLREGLRSEEREVAKLSPADARHHLDEWVLDAWLDLLVRRSRPPELRAAGSGDPIVLSTDHYRVRDWDALADALAAEPDVEGSRERGGWTRIEKDGGIGRVLVALNVGEGDRLAVFAQTLRRADEGREWLARVAGDLLAFRARDVVDPREAFQNPERRRREPPPDEVVTLPPAAHQEMIEKVYADWAKQPIPALGGRTPRQATRSKLGRERLTELLLSYEHEERREARAAGRPPVDFGFLWRAAGIERPAPGGES